MLACHQRASAFPFLCFFSRPHKSTSRRSGISLDVSGLTMKSSAHKVPSPPDSFLCSLSSFPRHLDQQRERWSGPYPQIGVPMGCLWMFVASCGEGPHCVVHIGPTENSTLGVRRWKFAKFIWIQGWRASITTVEVTLCRTEQHMAPNNGPISAARFGSRLNGSQKGGQEFGNKHQSCEAVEPKGGGEVFGRSDN